MFKSISMLFLLSASAVSAQNYLYPAEMPCISYENSIEFSNDYGETVLFRGVGYQDWFNIESQEYGMSPYILEFRVNQDSGSYSIVQVYADGTSCLMGTGTDFEPHVN